MERTESTIVQVNPNYENQKVQEMQIFGWNLQGRQEVVGHLQVVQDESLTGVLQRGLSEATSGTLDSLVGNGGSSVTYDHYVKLHFVRSLSMPNIKELRDLEASYRGLSLPAKPKILPGGWLIVFWYPLWPVYFFVSYRPKKAAWDKAVQDVEREAARLVGEANKLSAIVA